MSMNLYRMDLGEKYMAATESKGDNLARTHTELL